MILNMYSIFDVASGAYMRPFFLLADAQAVRSFSEIVGDPEHEVGKHPEDYSLVRIGTFDDQQARIHPEDVQVLVTGLEVVSASRNAANGDLFKVPDTDGLTPEEKRLGQ